MSLLPFWALNVVVVFLSMQGQKALGFHHKYLNMCSEDERRSYKFGRTRGWIINARIFIFGWTIPLIIVYWNTVVRILDSDILGFTRGVQELVYLEVKHGFKKTFSFKERFKWLEQADNHFNLLMVQTCWSHLRHKYGSVSNMKTSVCLSFFLTLFCPCCWDWFQFHAQLGHIIHSNFTSPRQHAVGSHQQVQSTSTTHGMHGKMNTYLYAYGYYTH